MIFDSLLVGFEAWVKLQKHISEEYLFRFIRLKRGKEFKVQMFAINLFFCFTLVFMGRHGRLWFVSLIIDCQYKISQITCFQITNTAKQSVFLGEKAKKDFSFLRRLCCRVEAQMNIGVKVRQESCFSYYLAMCLWASYLVSLRLNLFICKGAVTIVTF